MSIFKDKVALITGSTGEGMGRSIAFTFARERAKVILNYGTGHPNNVSASEKVLTEVRSLGGKGYAFKSDTRDANEVAEMVAGVIRLYGQLDFLIVNSGGGWDAMDITELENERWRSNLEAEIDGLYHCVKYALPPMRKAGFGRIVALGMAGVEWFSGPPYDYMVGKSARNAFIRSLARSELRHGITCNVVAPGHTPRVTMKQAVEAAKHGTQWRRRATVHPQDAAEVVKFLCSDAGSFVTGSIIELTGVAP
jgi:3-oxoacyl-[acyl-carrier protein] reductase